MENQAEDPNAVSAHYVGASFSEDYYKMLRMHPDLVHRFYDDPSEPDKDTTSVSTMQGINEVLRSLDMKDYSAKIRTVDSQFSHNDGVIVLVTGSFDGNDESKRFSQTFFLASRASADGKKLYFVLNDIFRFDDDDCSPPTPAAAELTTVVDEAPVEVVAESVEVVVETVEVVAENGHHAPENGVAEGPVESVKAEAPLANGSTEEAEAVAPAPALALAPKKSFASVVSALKLNAAPFQVRAPQLKPVEQHRARAPVVPKPEPVAPASSLAVNGSVEKNTESAPAKSHAIFVANLPMSATVDELDKVFKQFGPIKREGIQVRSSKQLGTCFGFVEYESASSMQSALEASPVVFGARKLSIEERRATNDRPKFSSGRGGGYRNDNFRGGRGNFNGNNRGYGRNEFSGRGRGNGNNAPRNGEALQKSNVSKEDKAAATPEATVKA